jgi:two-component system, OmpR family, response regulator
MMLNAKILVVEDDESLGFLIKDSLDSHGWTVDLYKDGEKGLSGFHSHSYDLCVLDIMLPKKDGYDVASEIRKYNTSIPIVFLTAKSQTQDKIRGFQVGADDYVCKPFSIDEFKYRLEAILRRSHSNQDLRQQDILKVSRSTLNIPNLTLDANGEVTRLTYKECKLLQLFFAHAGKVIERDIFLKTVWENDGFFVARSMDVFVSRLRKYLKKDTDLSIENIRGVGYVLARKEG